MKPLHHLDKKAICILGFFWALWFVSFTARTLLSPVMPIIEDEFSISHTKAGSLFALISLGNGLSLFVMGLFSGAIGYKRTFLLSYLSSGLLLLVMAFIERFAFFYPLLFSIGFSTGAYLPCVLPTLTRLYHERLWAKILPIHDSAAPTSILVAPFMALILLQYLNWRSMFFFLGLFFLLLGLLFHVLMRPLEEIKARSSSRRILGELLKDRSLWLLSVVWIFAAGANMGLYYILPLFLTKELMLDLSFANKTLGISRMGALFFAIFVGFILDLFETRKFLFSLLFCAGVLTFIVPSCSKGLLPFVLFSEAMIVTGFFPSSFVLASRLFELEKRSFATGFMVSLGSMLGIGGIPYVLGIFGDHLTFSLGIRLLGLCLMGASLLIFKIQRL